MQATTPTRGLQEAQPADAALVFGAVVRNGVISPLHAERLDAASALYERGIIPQIVVSNQQLAAKLMRDYLITKDVPEHAIRLDGRAGRSPAG